LSLESATFVTQLNASFPEATSTASRADDHIRLWKTALQGSLPNVVSVVNSSSNELNQIVGIGVQVQSQLNSLGTAVANTSASLNADIRASSASLSTSIRDFSANLDAKVEALSDSLAPTIEAMSVTYSVNVDNMSAGLDNQIRTLSATLSVNKLNLSATADDTISWGGSHQFFQTATPTTMIEGDLWFQL